MSAQPHKSVLLDEAVAALGLKHGDVAVDLTVGAGGHTERLLEAVGKTGRVIGFDRDETALVLARKRLAQAMTDGRLTLVKEAFADCERVLSSLGHAGQITGMLADIGVSSMHLDQAERGFSFQNDGPLDMRMDQSVQTTAATLVNELSESELVAMFRDLGEEPKAKQVARRICEVRQTKPLATTRELAELVVKAVKYPTPSKKHPATRVFQALRIAVNDELGQLAQMLEGSFKVLKPGGRIAIISFHSLEDRIVKDCMVQWTGRRERQAIPRHLPMMDRDVQKLHAARAEVVKPFPTMPSEHEINTNPRARSAKLRIAIKL